MGKIVIPEFAGIFTNADKEDIDPKFMVGLENLRPVPGKLEKTFGFGAKLNAATAAVLNNLTTYINDSLSGDKLYLGVVVSSATDLVTLYAWNGTAWAALSTISGFSAHGEYSHKIAQNPIVLHNDILRILPGNLGKGVNGGSECEGIWIGYIDREYFDGIYDPTAQFYDIPTTIDAPDLSFVTTQIVGGDYNADDSGSTQHYKFSYIYDGNQESLMSDALSIVYSQNRFAMFTWTITKASHNKRVTAMNVYRAYNPDAVDCPDPEGPYYLIHTIDFTREADSYESSAGGADQNGGGLYRCYIPDNGITDFAVGTTYTLKMGAETASVITNISNGAMTFFELTDPATDVHWDDSWEIKIQGGASKGSDTTGAYGGRYTFILDEDIGTRNFAGGILWVNATNGYTVIKDNYKRALRITDYGTGVSIAGQDDVWWKAFNPAEGNYYVSDETDDVDYMFWDTSWYANRKEFPHSNVEYTKVNGKFARMIGGRLWQADIVLDPGNTNEAHWDWGSYSEIDMPDVTPVGNVRRISDREGGGLTGLAEINGNPVFLKKQGIVTIKNTKLYPTEPGLWRNEIAGHNIGNIAPYGYIEVLESLYVVYYDGIYKLRPNNLAESDSTPTETLKITYPIEDIFLALTTTQKAAVKSTFCPLKGEILFDLNGSVYAYNVATENWRQIDSSHDFDLAAYDENGNPLIYDTADKKTYSPAETESVGVSWTSKTFKIAEDDDAPQLVRHIDVNYKSGDDLTLKVYDDTDVDSGDIQYNVTYTNNGYTSVTYSGTAYSTGETFTGEIGKKTYTTSGTGTVRVVDSHTLSANTAFKTKRIAIDRWMKKLVIEIEETTGSTNNVVIGEISIHTAD